MERKKSDMFVKNVNPYYDQNFFTFFFQLGKRFIEGIQGKLSVSDLASDEIQILVLLAIAISGALVGCFLVLRKMVMLANALSHTILIGIVMAFLFTKESIFDQSHSSGALNMQAMLLASLFTGIATAFLTQFLTKTVRLQEDASIGLVFTTLFALGVILVTLLTRNVHIGTEVVMGNVDALHWNDLRLVYTILFLNVALIFLFFKEYQITTFDSGLSKALGFSIVFFDYLLMIQVSATVVGAFRAVGVLMVLAFLTGPALTARLLTHDLKRMLFLASLIGSLSAVSGVALCRHILSFYGVALSTAGVVVCVMVLFYLLSMILAPEQGVIATILHRHKMTLQISKKDS